jgi:hypothetical protein
MPETNDPFLYVRASRTDKTYVGGTFCHNEADLRAIYELPFAASLAVDIELGREAVHGGMEPDEAMSTYRLNGSVVGRKDTAAVINACFNTIAAGGCAVYPLETSTLDM